MALLDHLPLPLVLAGLLAFAAPASAQAPKVLPGPLAPGAPAPAAPEAVYATYDIESDSLGDVRRAPMNPGDPAVGRTAAATGTCFDNSELGVCGMTAFAAFTVGDRIGDELLDWGVKSCGGTGMVQSLTLCYRTTALDPSAGGPGAALSFGLYEGTRGFNRVGSEVFRRVFLGLPGHLGPVDPHTAPFVFLTIDFGSRPLALPDGPIGWGYMVLDGLSGPLLVVAPNAGTGVEDALDVFAPGPASTGLYLGTFNYASTPCNHPPCCPHASTWLQVTETTPSTVVVNGSGSNPMVFSEQLPPRLGQAWVASISLLGHSPSSETLVYASLGEFGPRAMRWGELLIDPSMRIGSPLSRSAPGSGIHVVPIPSDLALYGLEVHTQGVIQDGGFELTNGLVLTLGL